ncbi:hypothetical protein QVD17_04770 [Tagetes erecta]|uniref:histone acetyltransferase n=1 Tax=Tagetes erecta TaxID=13708 RepID=A0AAD8LIE3_TARER|nr:hypothetical protein QVD17_04770 [Tagetes erecta]
MLKQQPADWDPVNVNQFIANFAEETIDKDKWFGDLLNHLNTPIETPMGYSFQKLNDQGTCDHVTNHNPMIVSHQPVMSSIFDSSMNTAAFFGGGSTINNVIFNNGVSANEAFHGRTATPGGLCCSFPHSPAQNIYQQKPCHQSIYSMGFQANGLQPNFQNNPESALFMGGTYNAQTSNGGMFLQPQVHMPDPQRPSQWVSQVPVRGQSNWFKNIPQSNSWGSVQGQPPGAEASFSHNCNGLNCSVCGQATFGMESRKRKYHFGPPVNETWSGDGALMESRNPKYPFEPVNNESWVGNDSIMDVLANSYLPFDLPPLEQWPYNSEDVFGPDANNKIAEDATGNGPDGNEESSQLRTYVPSGTLMDVYNSFMKYSASTQDAMGPKVNKVPTELRSEEEVICGFNSALDDYEAVLESMQSMEPSVSESEKKSTHITSFDDNGPEVEIMDVKKSSTALANSFEYNGSGLESRNSNKQSASLADSLTASQIKEHLSTFIQPEKDISGNTSLTSQNPCQLCYKSKLLLAPTPVYCSSCDLRIKQNAKYYRSTDENIKHCICMGCFRGSCGSTIVTRGGSVVKASLHMAKNDEEIEDSWVLCDTCQQWQHRICGLYNNETDLEGKAEYVCPKCCLKEIENGTRVSLPKNVVGAKDLPRTNLSDHIEQRLFTRIKQEREESAKFHGIELEKVPVAEGLVVRVVVSVDKELEVKKQFRDIFHGHDYPEKIEYRSKLILLFQKIGGVDVCIFGMYVQEFGSECNGPNNRCVYISYIDSVKYFQPERKTASGEPLRTFVYHEILLGYLEHCKKRGFTSCYIWSCPLIKGEDYIFYCHPKTQKTPEKIKLRKWYKQMIRKAVKNGIVVDQTNLFNEFFIPTSNKISASRLPYFDGDFWSKIAEDTSKKLDEEESSEGRSCIKSRPKRISGANSQEMPTKDDLVMHKLGDILLPEKENYMILRLQHTCTSCKETILSGSRWFCKQCNKIQLCSRCFSEGKMSRCGSCKKTKLFEDVLSSVPVDTKDNDGVLVNNFFQTRSKILLSYKNGTCHTHKLIPASTKVTPEPRKERPQNQKTKMLCSMDKLLLTPATIYFSSCDLRIKQNVNYYLSIDEDTSTQHRVLVEMKLIQKGSRICLSKMLLTTNLSDHIRQRLHMHLKQETAETTKLHGIELEEVTEDVHLVVRVVASICWQRVGSEEEI